MKSRLERADEIEPVFHQARHQEAAAYGLARVAPQPFAQAGVLDDLDDARRCLFDIIHKESAHTVLDLMLDPADITADDGGAFPHRLADGKPEALADRLL